MFFVPFYLHLLQVALDWRRYSSWSAIDVVVVDVVIVIDDVGTGSCSTRCFLDFGLTQKWLVMSTLGLVSNQNVRKN